MTDLEHPLLERGYLTLDGKRYKYEIRLMDVEFNHLPVINHFEVENEEGEKIETIIFEGEKVEDRIRKVVK